MGRDRSELVEWGARAGREMGMSVKSGSARIARIIPYTLYSFHQVETVRAEYGKPARSARALIRMGHRASPIVSRPPPSSSDLKRTREKPLAWRVTSFAPFSVGTFTVLRRSLFFTNPS